MDDRQTCAHCHAFNPPGAIICASCGVNLEDLRASVPRLLEIQSEKASSHAEKINQELNEIVDREVASDLRRIRTLIVWTLVVALVLAVVVAVTAIFLANRERAKNMRLAAEFAQALICFQNDDLNCAEQRINSVLDEDADYPGAQQLLEQVLVARAEYFTLAEDWLQAVPYWEKVMAAFPNDSREREKLNQARYALASGLIHSGKWQEALDQVEKIMSDKPGDSRAIALMNTIFAGWENDALSHWDLLTIWYIRLQRKSRNP